MKYHNITKDDMLNGDGLRVVLWVSGCEHHCHNCQNPITWNPNNGLDFDLSAIHEIYEQLQKPYISGLTISGGDPLYKTNITEVTNLVKDIKTKFPDKTIWIYTGYSWDKIKNLEVVQFIDVIVDGKFIKKLAEINCKWAGSTNQRVIDVQASLKANEVILHE